MPPALSSTLRNHYPGAIALTALVIASGLAFWLMHRANAVPIAADDWRQIGFIFCTGLVIGGFAAELSAFIARTSPGETPIGSALVAAIFALPSYALMILLCLVAAD